MSGVDASSFFTVEEEQGQMRICLRGKWLIRHLHHVERAFLRLPKRPVSVFIIDCTALEKIDTAGVWLLLKVQRYLTRRKRECRFDNVPKEMQDVLDGITPFTPSPKVKPPLRWVSGMVSAIGKQAYDFAWQVVYFVSLLGMLMVTLLRWIVSPRRIRFTMIMQHIVYTGANAMPIIALIAFLISVVLTYQGSSQLKQFGAEIFTVNLVAVSVLREMGVLLTAILVAGRSGSAFTAQIGAMKLNEEIDALSTIGLNPVEILVLPRVLALMISLPLLTFFSDVMGVLGGAVMSNVLLNISYTQFFQRVEDIVTGWTFWIGMIKAPFFALAIGMIGCLRGLQIHGNAESLGNLTTKAVVESIFLVIIADALFSILFTQLGI